MVGFASALALSCAAILTVPPWGRHVYAIGANPQAARVSGINVQRHIVLVYTLAGLLSGLAGLVTAARAQSGQSSMGLGYELDAIAAASGYPRITIPA